ncbi:MAG: RluA family pseudouridine synthase [Spirochaetales bacterium]|nr:RluA family pseudouridine synthase [Spirochaetales bacterium]
MKIDVLYEDNHLIIVNKPFCVPVQSDKTGDPCLLDMVKDFIKKRDNKPGNVFLGLAHRLDRPTSGVIVLAKTSKALSRMNELIRDNKIEKTYWAVTVAALPQDEGRMSDFLLKNSQKNMSRVVPNDNKGGKKATLDYELVGGSDNYFLYKIKLITGRHHQIRVQFSSRGASLRGDLKYGAPRSNKDGSIDLFAGKIKFVHPVSGEPIEVLGKIPDSNIWRHFSGIIV